MKIDFGNPFINRLDATMWWGIVTLLSLLIFSTAAGQTVLILLILFGLVKIFRDKKKIRIKNPILLPFIVFVAVRILSILFSEFPSLSLPSLNKEIFFYIIFFIFLIELTEYDEKKIRFLFKILVIAAVLASVVGTVKVIVGLSERAQSTTSGYSTLGLFLSVIFAIIFPLGDEKDFFPSRSKWFIILIILATGILFAFNRSNWISVGIIILLIGLYKEKKILITLITIFTIVILLIPSLSNRFEQLVNFIQNLSDRDVLWKGALMIWDQHPILGFGTKSFNEIFLLRSYLADKGVGGWHNEYLQIYMESGAIGLIAFLWLTISIFYWGIKVLKNLSSENINFKLMLAVLAGMLVFYGNSITGGFIFDPIIKVLFFFLLAVECVIINSNLKKNTDRKDDLLKFSLN